MRNYSIVATSVLALLLVAPVIALGSLTNLLVLDSSASGPNMNIYLYEGAQDPNDKYDFGNCTYWVALLRSKIGESIPNNWGNAIDWAVHAQAEGYLVDHTPTFGSIMQDPNAPGGLGHVAFVESVDQSSGEWTISEMNRVGFDEVDTRVMPASSANSYNFIHSLRYSNGN